MREMGRISGCILVATMAMAFFAGSSFGAEAYPTKPVTLIVPYSAGGVSDTVARLISDTARKYFPEQIVVENRPGASGTRAVYDLVTAKPDGYTLCLASSSEASSALHMVPANYKLDSYAIISHVGTQPVTVSTSGDWGTLKDLIDYGQKNPGKIRAGVSGVGGVTRLVGSLWASKAGIDVKIVPFQGSGPLIPAVMGRHVEVGFLNVPEVVAHYKAKSMKVLCVFAEERSKALPQVPTAKELGYDVAGGSTHFMLVPKATPPAVQEKLLDLMKKVEADKDFQEKTTALGYSAYYKDAKASQAFLQDWYEVSGKLFDSLGLKKR